MQRKFTVPFHIPGTLSADLDIRFIVPSDCQLVHVSAVASNDSAALLTIGDSADTDEYLTSTEIGDSQAPAEFDGDNFVDSDGNSHTRYYPHITDGTIVVITLDYDGDSSVAADDFTIVLTFVEG